MTYISTLPTPPSRSDDPTGFSNKADALLGALPDFVTEANALSDEVDAMRDDAEAKRAATATLKAETQDIKDAAVSECGTIKTACETARDLAQTYKNNAETAKTQAETAKSNAEVAAAAAAAGAGLPALTGNAGKVLKVNSGETGVEFGFGLASGKQVFTTSCSWAVPAEATWVYVEAVAAGAGGANNTGAGPVNANGGGGGEFVRGLFRAADLSSPVAVTIGAGGTAMANGSTGVGGNGGDSSFGSILVARGGKNTGASGQGNGSLEGMGCWETCSPNSRNGYVTSTTYGGGGGGDGDAQPRAGAISAYHGNGGNGSSADGVAGTAGQFPGGGGGGSANNGGSGPGADGEVTVYWW